ncbi:hypothetical protein G7067_07110 [Leucobacter insecticola]|uniref:Phosphotriesterase n=1 Tax=Leucobacter insecticola TaxID=2714934 RepID=A0A6G8FIR7_9MICO|nr:hypothetical protein [Leucobacter insecticola]QIM16241.1 hypothetical protein G7067_07110 [Leucobacter insecticola]
MITSVCGPVAGSAFDVLLAAEPLLLRAAPQTRNSGGAACEAEFERAPVTIERLGRLQLGESNRDDRTLDARDAKGALERLAQAGSVAVIVLDDPRAGPERPALMAELSRETGVTLIRSVGGSGVETPDALYAHLSAQLGAREHPAGIVGLISARDHHERIAAAAQAAREAGTAILIDAAAGADEVSRALVASDAAGLARERVVLTGATTAIAARDIETGVTTTGVDEARLLALLAHGTALCFDDLGRIPNVRTVVSDHNVAETIMRCAELGAAHRILLSSGIRNKHRLTAWGGNGLEFVPEQFAPYLRLMGLSDELVRAVSGGNAVRILGRTGSDE